MSQKPKQKRRFTLCKVKDDSGDTLIFYKDNTCRWDSREHMATFEWQVVYNDTIGNMFFYKNDYESDWSLWDGEVTDENKRFAAAIVDALASIEIDKMLRGKNVKSTKTTNNPA